MKKILTLNIIFLFSLCVYSQPPNDNCLNAISLTLGTNLCGQSGECYLNFTGTQSSMWYSFSASTSSLVVDFIQNNSTNSPPDYMVFGPYTTLATGCVNVTSACTGGTVLAAAQPTNYISAAGGVSFDYANGDPGNYVELNGLSTVVGNNTYLIQIQNNNTAGSFSRWTKFCLGVHNVAGNTMPTAASLINSCGVTFNGSTAGGYFPNASGPGFSNLDNNAATQCAACGGNPGSDLTYVINNPSWYTFCSSNAGTYNVSFNVNSCVNSSFTGATGSQMALLTGNTSAFTNVWQAASPTLVGAATQTSPNFTLAAGGCAYLVVDGFAGDACSYSYVLTNVTGGCILLPIELLSFNALQKGNEIDLTWATATEKNNKYFSIEKSENGVDFKSIEIVNGSGTTVNAMFYSSVDHNPLSGISYYRLKQTDYDGKFTYSSIVSVDYKNDKDLKFDIIPNPSSENELTRIVFNINPEKAISVCVTDINGITLYEETKNVINNAFEIPNNFSKGMYFVKIISSNVVQTKRMIIK
jgi:hypothetical protein